MDEPNELRYEAIARELRRRIAAGELRAGQRLPTLRELRREFGITQATVDKANALLEKEGLIVRSHRSGIYVAPPVEKELRGVIGFFGVEFSRSSYSPYWAALIHGVEVKARELGVEILLLQSGSPSGWQKVDGVLINGNAVGIAAEAVPAGLPLVACISPAIISGDEAQRERVLRNTSLVRANDYAGAYGLTEYLLGLGHWRIAYLHNGRNAPQMLEHRVAGYRAALSDGGVTADPALERALPSPSPNLFFFNAGRDAVREWLGQDWAALGCTALLTHNDDTAWGAIEAFREAGLSVPGDVSVVGFDGTEVGENCNPTLTTGRVPLEEIGATALEMLWRRVKGYEGGAEVVQLPVEVVVRGSTGRPSGASRRAGALR